MLTCTLRMWLYSSECGIRVFAGSIKASISRRDCPRLGWTVNPWQVSLSETEKRHREQRGHWCGHGSRDGRDGAKEAKAYREPRAEEKAWEQTVPTNPQEEPTLQYWLWTGGLQNCAWVNSGVQSLHTYGNLLLVLCVCVYKERR